MRGNLDRSIVRFAAFAAVFAVAASSSPTLIAHGVVTYDRDVEPILTRSCGGGSCHINQTTSGVNMATYRNLLASVGDQYGGPIVVPGDPAASPVLDKVSSPTPAFGSPMPLVGDPLTPEEIHTLEEWIEGGAIESELPLRGDANDDGALNLTDAIVILSWLFRGSEGPPCPELADANADGSTNLTDPVFLLTFLFQGGERPARLTEEEDEACRESAELSFESIWENVFRTTCAFSSCHSSETRRGDLSLETADEAWDGLVGVEPFNQVARDAGMFRVDSGVPENSFLLRKLLGPGPGEGNRMPANSPEPISDGAIDAIREWIRFGAPREGTITGVPDIDEESLPPIERIPAPPAPENGIQIHLEPFTIAPRSEREIFSYVEKPFAALGLDQVLVERIDIHMSDASHHFILYEWIGATPPPAGLRPIGEVVGILDRRSFIVGAQQAFFTLSFPEGVGLRFGKDTSFDLNSHYLNLNGSEPLQGEVYVNIFFAEPGSITTFVRPIFEINPVINVPPNETRTTEWVFPGPSSIDADPSLATSFGRLSRETHIYSLSSHMHRHGDRFRAFLIQDGRHLDPPRMVYESFDWDDPVYKVFEPPLVLEEGQGIRFATTHTYHDPPSPTAPPLTFDVTSEDEMAILLGYYAVP